MDVTEFIDKILNTKQNCQII